MRYTYFSYRRVINVILAALLVILCLMFIIENPLYAVEDYNTNNANSVERAYRNDGYVAGVWLASPETPYRSTQVNVPYGHAWVTVHIRGSWYTGGNNYRETYTMNLRSESWILTEISSADFSRGTTDNPGGGAYVYNPSGYKTAKLYVGQGICQGKAGQTVEIKVDIWNQLSYRVGNNWRSGIGNTDTTPVHVNCLAPSWLVTGSSWVTKYYNSNHTNYGTGWVKSPGTVEAKPGDTIDWWHSLLVHDADMNEAIRNGIQQDVYNLETGESLAKSPNPDDNGAWRFSGDFKGKKSDDWKAWAWYRDYNAYDYNNTWLETIYGKSTVEQVRGKVDKFMYTRKIKHDDVGKKICQRVYWSKSSPSYSGGYLYSDYACVAVPHKYNLTPTLSVDQKTIDAGENKVAGINARFGHDGSTTKTKNNDKHYAVVKYKVPKGQNLVLPAKEGIVARSGNWPCEAIKKINGSVDCQGDLVKTKHTGELQLNQSVTMLNSHTDDVSSSNLQFGDKICYVAMVSAYNQNANQYTFKTSQAQCVTVDKTPKVQVWGGDIKTDKDVITNKTSSANQNVYGSWGEYGIIANGKAYSASGAGLSSSFNGRSGVTPRDSNKLTFANIPKFGNFSSTSSVPDNFTLPSVGGTRGNISGNVDVNSLASGEYNAGNVTLTGSKLSVGKSIVIKSSGVVRISGDLLYTDTNDVRQLPQLIIYAKNIIIEPSVGEVNAWLITQKDGYVSTCGVVISFGDWLSGVSESSCGKKQLKVNGPIKTGRLFLRRTYGGKHASSAKNDPNMHPGTPAEIINLRADTYIWAYNNYRNTGAISTMNIRELPPRY